MTTWKKWILRVVVMCAILGVAGVSYQTADTARAVAPLPQAGAAAPAVSYTGQLTDFAGQPVADGVYDFIFTLFDQPVGGAALWSETQVKIPVKGGKFTALMGNAAPFSAGLVGMSGLWLGVQVRSAGEVQYTALSPNLPFDLKNSSAPTASGCIHTHMGDIWSGGGLAGLTVDMPSGNFSGALFGQTGGLGNGVYGRSVAINGVSNGVWGETKSPDGAGGYFINTGEGKGVYVEGAGGGAEHASLRVVSTKASDGMAGYFTNTSNYANTHFQNSGDGEVLVVQSHAGTFARFVDDGWDAKFRFDHDGIGYSDSGWTTPAADFAEMLPAADGLQPGEVLVIGADGKLRRSSQARQASVVGVYSTKPGFVAGQPMEGAAAGSIPLAVVGVVPVKASAENGAIHPGDLLVSASLPGTAMWAGDDPQVGTVIGKALGSLEAGMGVIQMLVMLQ